MPKNAITKTGRVHFQSVFAPSAFNKDMTPQYSLTLTFEPEDAKPLEEAAHLAAAEKWGDNIPRNINWPFRSGDEVSWEGFEGRIGVKFSSKFAPEVVDEDLLEILEESGDFYDGCYARVSYSIYAYDNIQKGVKFNLHNIQKMKDGERITGSREKASDTFS